MRVVNFGFSSFSFPNETKQNKMSTKFSKKEKGILFIKIVDKEKKKGSLYSLSNSKKLHFKSKSKAYLISLDPSYYKLYVLESHSKKVGFGAPKFNVWNQKHTRTHDIEFMRWAKSTSCQQIESTIAFSFAMH